MYQNDFEFVRLFKAYSRILDFRGRSTRTELLGYWVATWVISTAVTFLMMPADYSKIDPLIMVMNAIILIPAPALAVRRAHDIGLPGIAALLLIVPAAVSMVLDQVLEPYTTLRILLSLAYVAGLIMLLWKPQDGDNRFGPDPRLVDA